jgi:hypothetical protein
MATKSTSVHSKYSGVIVSKTEMRKIRDSINVKMNDLYKVLLTQLAYIGEEAVKIAREKGSYMDVTGNLRSSIGYCVLADGEPVVNGKTERFEGKVGKGEEGAAASQALLGKLKSKFPQGLVLIVCAGMNYAAEVEHVRHKDVLTSAELRAEALANKLLGSLTE